MELLFTRMAVDTAVHWPEAPLETEQSFCQRLKTRPLAALNRALLRSSSTEDSLSGRSCLLPGAAHVLWLVDPFALVLDNSEGPPQRVCVMSWGLYCDGTAVQLSLCLILLPLLLVCVPESTPCNPLHASLHLSRVCFSGNSTCEVVKSNLPCG